MFCDWTCRWFYIDFIRCYFWTPSQTSSCFMSTLPRCALFSRALFWCHQSVFGVTNRTPEALTVTEQMHLGCRHFCHQPFWSLWSEILMTYCSVRETMHVHEKRCVLLCFTSINFLLLMLGNYSGQKLAARWKIMQQANRDYNNRIIIQQIVCHTTCEG